ncbi:MAG: hypothetical protein HQL24_01970 [Candidatus Omnitrophica bacterium]|nr:hypothetical protein [Candidatus Omnitrophota bacterium]
MKKNLNIEPFLFLFVVLIEVFFAALFVFSKRIVLHDSLLNFFSQYYFYNSIAMHKEIPLWVPYMTHGIPSAWRYALQGGNTLLTDVFTLGGFFLNKVVNFLILYRLGILFNKLFFLVGVWLLSQKYYRHSSTRFFVAACCMASTVVETQVNWNFLAFYAIPLLFYFFHQFLESPKWRYIFLGINLFCLQITGNYSPYIPIISLFVFLYIVFYGFLHPAEIRSAFSQLKRQRFPWLFFAWTSSVVLALGCLLYFAKDPNLVSMIFGRQQDGSVSLQTFLTYGGNSGLRLWKELFFGFSPAIDHTVFIGFLSLPLMLIGIFLSNDKKKMLPLLGTGIVFLLFSLSTFVSVFFYYVWPLMKFYRHLALSAPFIKLCLCFLAGFGFETLFFDLIRRERSLAKIMTVSLSGAMMFSLALLLSKLAVQIPLAEKMISKMFLEESMFINDTVLPSFFTKAFFLGSIFLFVYSIAFFCLFILPKKWFKFAIGVFLLMHAVNMWGYAYSEGIRRTFPLNSVQYNFLRFKKMPFYPRRQFVKHSVNGTYSLRSNNERNILLNVRGLLTYSRDNSLDAFLFNDFLFHLFRTDVLEKPVDKLIEIYHKTPFQNTFLYQKNLQMVEFLGAIENIPVPYLKIAGVSQDKLQVFSTAYDCSDEKKLAAYLVDEKYQGSVLFVSKGPQGNSLEKVPNDNSGSFLSGDNRVYIPCEIVSFSPNTLEVIVDIIDRPSAWLYYSDAWHPFWKATVNDKSVGVYKADIAYKAVPLVKGMNRVKFYYEDNKTVFLQFFFALNGLFWVGMGLYLAGRICFNPCKNSSA